MRLSELKSGESAVIVKILGHGAFRKRVIEMGFNKGRHIEAILSAPLRDPVKYRLMGYEVSLRRSEAYLIEVMPMDSADENIESSSRIQYVDDCSEHVRNEYSGRSHVINVALIGNPNCGKTSLFNVVSGATEHVGNYSGVTVDSKTGTFEHNGYRFNIVDLPGTYSLAAYSPEELYVRRYLTTENPDVIVNVVDASNLARNLYLTTELIDMDRSMVIALNMYDELKRSGDKLDYKYLGEMVGVPIVPTVSRTGEGMDRLFDTIIEVFEGKNNSVRHVHVNLGADIEEALNSIKDEIKRDGCVIPHFSPRYLAIKLLEGDSEAENLIAPIAKSQDILALRDRQVKQLEQMHDEDVTSLIANEKYGFISGALAETYEHNKIERVTSTQIIDTFVTNKLFGFPIFLAVMLFIFWATFSLGQYPQDWIQAGVDWLSVFINGHMSDGPLKSLIADGVIGGVGGVIVFLPQIMILYFFISFMEDSGYMSRAAFIMDRLMHKIGLHGKSFIPLVMGFGCNVPAIMASRAIESRSSRLITILINPFMSCSARVPIYVLLIGAFFDAHAALVFFALYALGVFVAIMTARLLRKVFFKKDETPFVMELPPYRLPTMKSSLLHMWWKGEQYLKKMGGIILVASIIVWALNYFPLHDGKSSENVSEITVGQVDDSAIDISKDSYLEMIGKVIAPVMKPLGFSWRASVAALAGVPAKEIVVSTLGVLYTGDEAIDDNTLGSRIKASGDFPAATALSFLVFILLYCPCIASITAIIKETGSWRYGAFSVIYNTVVAWVVALIVYNAALLFS